MPVVGKRQATAMILSVKGMVFLISTINANW